MKFTFILIVGSLICFPLIYAKSIPTIAVTELDAPDLSANEVVGLTNRLRSELINTGKFTVLERSKMNDILKEQGFQQTGCTNTDCAVEIGQLLNVEYIILGSIDKVGQIYSVNIRLVNVGSGKIEKNENVDCSECTIEDIMLKTIKIAARKMAGIMTSADRLMESKLLSDRKLQTEQKASTIKGGREKNTATMYDDMVWIPGGTFMMGSNNGNDDERPVHQVTLDGFYMDKTEVTYKDFIETIGESRDTSKNTLLGRKTRPKYPVVYVTWYEANEHCEKQGKRLPTEAEWEYAARAGSTTKYYWGDTMNGDYAWHGNNGGDTINIVGQKKPNKFGLYDMIGNVYEWCADKSELLYEEGKNFDETLENILFKSSQSSNYKNSPVKNPQGPATGSNRMIRGGSWIITDPFVKPEVFRERIHTSTSRVFVASPHSSNRDTGFRCVRSR